MSENKASKTVHIDYDLMYEYVATAMRAIDQEEDIPAESGEGFFGANGFTRKGKENRQGVLRREPRKN